MRTLLFLVITIGLQFILSKQQNKYLGLILPVINVIYSLIFLFAFVPLSDFNIIHAITLGAYILFVNNISTIILLAIYYFVRKKYVK